jgi:Tol biopolymer transport system component/serine/threonine protein kinase
MAPCAALPLVEESASDMPEMDPERWRAVSLRLDEALDLPEDGRAQWMATLREQDPTLADEVRSLLEDYEIVRRKHFLEQDHGFRPGARIADGAAIASALAGRIFGAYKLVSPIGQGGMGVVWLAERCDGHFEGRAAVKLLDILRVTRSAERFRREASILARVTHPNIAHLIDAGVSSDGQPYLVLELVDGQPIDRYCDDRALDVGARIRLMLDVLGAVSHAHANRIVHRDIKPSNVLVRTDGHVKLLDFGIAKLVERDDQTGMTTLTLEQGSPLTPAYAAPEQVSGGRVTTATDVHALGVLLYVLLTGQHPCGALSSPADILKAIVEIDTPPPSAVVVAGKVPEALAALAANRATTPDRLHKSLKGDLDTIVAKALKKDPQERYASVADLAEDLRRYLASEPIRARRDSVIRRTTRFMRRHAGLTATGTIGTLALAGLTAFYAMRPATERSPAAAPELAAPVPITSEAGDESWPSLSPDHTRIAFSWIPPNATNSRIAIKTIGSDTLVQLTDSAAGDVMPVWSPDGQQLAFFRAFRGPELNSQICLMPATGGPPRVLLHEKGVLNLPGLAWWEGGNALLFSSRRPTTRTFQIAALDLATLDVRYLTNPPDAPQLTAPGDFLPALSPDKRTVAFVREADDGRDVYLLDLVAGGERRLTQDHHRITGLTWAPDGQAVIMSSFRSGVEALYRVGLRDGTIARVPNSGDWATQPMASRGGLVFSQAHSDSNVYRVDLRNARATGAARPLIASSRTDHAPHISPDGRSIAFLSTRAGDQDIWVASADGTNPRRLTFVPVTSGPRWSPDGRSIAFGALAPGLARPDIWVVDASGGAPTRLTTDPSFETLLTWAADSASVYFVSDRSGGFEVWNVPVRGGTATRVTQGGGLRAQESADGRFLYYANDVPEVWRRPLHGASAADLVTKFSKETPWGGDWLVGARGLYYLNEQAPGSAAIDYLPFGSGARASRVMSLTAPPSRSVTVFSVAPDESWLVWAQDDYRNSDIMMIKQR